MSAAFFSTTYKLNNGAKNLLDAQPAQQNNNKSFLSSI
jgi:hypothetical protein